jgi:hypothetical protein
MPEPSELFTNVYAKGMGVEVIKVSFLLDRLSVNQLLFVPRHVFSSRIVLNIKNLCFLFFFLTVSCIQEFIGDNQYFL